MKNFLNSKIDQELLSRRILGAIEEAGMELPYTEIEIEDAHNFVSCVIARAWDEE